MVNLSREDARQLQNTLQEAAIRCSERCLYQSAKWIAELSTSLPSEDQLSPGSDTDPGSPMQDIDQQPTSAPKIFSFNPDIEESRLEAQEASKYILAKSYFDCREYDRCAAVFLPSSISAKPLSTISADVATQATTKNGKGKGKESDSGVLIGDLRPGNVFPQLSQKALFMALYAKYISGEKKRKEESEMILGPADGGTTINKELVGLQRNLEGWFLDREAKGKHLSSQGWLEYLYGVVLIKGKSEEEGKKSLIQSVRLCPYNWDAWLELSGLLNNADDLHQIRPELPQNIMSSIFHVYACQELFQLDDHVFNQLSDLEQIFPESLFLKTQRALLFYHSKDWTITESLFGQMLQTDPHRLESLDIYSNLLYVLESRPKLAFLAQVAMATDKFRPETCCIIGNYYALKSEHEKAAMYFRRALTLDHNFQSAWTLMGHEYLEMKNTHAAIESYRRAVDINRKDFRAWYGLGQTYEMLSMNLYALFYFQRAASLKSYDPKMWQALADCYRNIDRPLQSIKAYKRALIAGTFSDPGSSFESSTQGVEYPSGALNPEILYSIACLYETLNNHNEAASFMELTIAQEDGPADGNDEASKELGMGSTATTSKARLWLARWELARDNLVRAMELANELCHDGEQVEDAKALIRDAKARMEPDRS